MGKQRNKLEIPSTSVILDSVADGVFTVDNEWKITSFNRQAEKITGISRKEALGKLCREVFHASICEGSCALLQTIKSGKPIVNKSIYIVNSSGKKVPVAISTAVLSDNEGKRIGGVETFRDISELEELRKILKLSFSFHDMVSKSSLMHELFAVLPDVAESNSTVLIEGASGTGKELLARAIHNLSHRKDGPMVVVNCAALPDNLLESELFGYRKGAFTDARTDRQGRFALAHGGTIFLDEIGDISSALQVRLLRVIQEKTYEPLGSDTSKEADVRVIAATHRNLKKLVNAGKFRDDLYYRLNVVRLELPLLKDRKEDLPLLLDHFIQRFNNLRGKEIMGCDDEALRILMEYDYPGNIRELENIIEYASIMCHGTLIQPQHLPREFQSMSSAVSISTGSTLKDMEMRTVYSALECNNWKRKAAAKELGIDRTTLWRKMKRLGIIEKK